MILLLSIEIAGSAAFQQRAAGITRALRGNRLVEPWERAVEFVAETAQKKASRWKGDMAAGIETEVMVESDGPLGVVYDDVFYSPFQEFGTREYWPNIDAITDWADDHGVSPFVVARAIHNRGVPPIKFFEQGLTENLKIIGDLVGDVVAEILMEEY